MFFQNYTTPSLAPSPTGDATLVQAQTELFIHLGNMSDLDPVRDFAAILNLGNALIEGDMTAIQKALEFYEDHMDLAGKHIAALNSIFASSGVALKEPVLIESQARRATAKSPVVLGVLLERAGRIAFVSSDPTIPSDVHGFVRAQKGMMALEPLHDDPKLLLKQASRIIRLPGPPPFAPSISS
jgi:hypothetical protein